MAAGITAPRDSDLQAKHLGIPIEGGTEAKLRRGDVIFWPAHVAILSAPDRVVHASGHHMRVVSEPLAEVVARVTKLVGPPVAVRRVDNGNRDP
jgi:cell wall-associated NlpC family hydrolase